MENAPQSFERPQLRRLDAIEGVVEHDDRDADGREQRSGRWISAASAIIASASAHRISRITGYCGRQREVHRQPHDDQLDQDQPQAARHTGTATAAAFEPSRANRSQAPAPARRKNDGAQTCVIQRVKKITGVVRVRSSGGNDIAAA